jgi:cytochrome c oxidase cbb3-type subunit III
MTGRWLVVVGVAFAVAAGCQREQRRFTEASPASGMPQTIRLSDLQPGGTPPRVQMQSAYDENAWAISQGKRYYEAFNCVGCHAHGGGGMGPPLMDDEWIYGSDPANIFATIVEGRPNGMPSFRGRIPTAQVWQITAYVRSLSGLTPKDTRSQRDDHMYVKVPEGARPSEKPKPGGSPP